MRTLAEPGGVASCLSCSLLLSERRPITQEAEPIACWPPSACKSSRKRLPQRCLWPVAAPPFLSPPTFSFPTGRGGWGEVVGGSGKKARGEVNPNMPCCTWDKCRFPFVKKRNGRFSWAITDQQMCLLLPSNCLCCQSSNWIRRLSTCVSALLLPFPPSPSLSLSNIAMNFLLIPTVLRILAPPAHSSFLPLLFSFCLSVFSHSRVHFLECKH